uniref:HhH-GPD domain-containing protein n=1 Tax=Ditylum brightwellii TaxID=49249 RepID=A0A7S2ESG7_9STRA|mmetsp:Transcript_4716/g.7245  ORF Transcript_4716/g.7245 Transcript_4716/m.7245 type:complete len:420 (+) Transcript_4716:93-1352(+)
MVGKTKYFSDSNTTNTKKVKNDISRFFLAKSKNKDSTSITASPTICKKPKRSSNTTKREDAWEKAIGLTVEDAIDIEEEDGEGKKSKKVDLVTIDNDENDGSPTMQPYQNDNLDKNEASDMKSMIDVKQENINSKETSSTKNDDVPSSSSIQNNSTSTPTMTTNNNTQSSSSPNNPFASFAFHLGGAESSYFDSTNGTIVDLEQPQKDSCNQNNKLEENETTTSLLPRVSPNKRTWESCTSNNNTTIKRNLPSSKSIKSTATSKTKSKTKPENSEEIPFTSLPIEQQIKIRTKWQNFSNPNHPIEIRRFHLWVAAKLHVRAHETIVTKAMVAIRSFFSSDFTVQQIAEAKQEEIAQVISFVNMPNSKAKHLIRGSLDIVKDWGGDVPEKVEDLMKITGIGPKLAEILSVVNRRDAYSSS